MLRRFILIAAAVISALILLDTATSVFSAFGEVGSNAKFVLVPVALVLGVYSVLDVFEIWNSKVNPLIVFAVGITALIGWLAARDGVEATRGTFERTETLSKDAGNQMHSVEEHLGIKK